ncbi:DUF84 family protein [Candidatus Pacearchaeota archaeon]|nr:DUF84 family protein [Candidatus Pacearchaeota archaeon]
MIINIGSKNPVKFEAVRQAFLKYQDFIDAEFRGIEVPVPESIIPEQPRGMEEIWAGAEFRARQAFRDCNYSVGLESGLYKVPLNGESLPRMNFAACVIFDGKRIYIGQNSGFVIPRIVAEIIQREKVQLDEAWRRAGLTDEERIGYGNGIIHGLTGGRFDRKRYLEQAVHMTVTHLLNKHLF